MQLTRLKKNFGNRSQGSVGSKNETKIANFSMQLHLKGGKEIDLKVCLLRREWYVEEKKK